MSHRCASTTSFISGMKKTLRKLPYLTECVIAMINLGSVMQEHHIGKSLRPSGPDTVT
jgi:hypothetical protein